MKRRVQGVGKENEVETSILSGLSRQRSGHRERGSPDSRKEGCISVIFLN